LLILIIPVILIQLISTYVFFDRHWSKVTTRLAFAVAGEVTVMAETIEDGPSATAMGVFLGRMNSRLGLQAQFEPGAKLDAVQKRRKSLAWESAVESRLAAELKAMLRRDFVLNIDFQKKWVALDVQLKNGLLRIEFPQRRLFSSSGRIFLLWMISVSFILLMIAIIFMRNQIRPIKKLAIAAERFGKGRDLPSFKPQGAREVRMAAQAFLDMHRRIRRQIEQRTAMLAGVSHDLRTPLTRLKLQVEMMGDGEDVKAMKGDIQAMETMIAGYLDFVRGEGDETASFTNVNALLDKVVKAAGRQGLKIACEAGAGMNANIRPMAFERCLMNLINNAGKYADHIWITAEIADKTLFITVEDDGPGIPEEHYDDVFRAFYRLDSSRNTETGGVGLGLPIAMDIVHAHGGKIWLERSAYGGLKACVTLPL
jgi:two-component system osmolarity sensor histidine kinase EnvZ